MNKIILNYVSDENGFSNSFLECYDYFEGFERLAKKIFLHQEEFQPVLVDISKVINSFIEKDVYDEWKITRVIGKIINKQNAASPEPVFEEIDGEPVEVAPLPEGEESKTIDLSLYYIRKDISGNKKERLRSNEMGELEENVLNIWNYLEGLIKTQKIELEASNKAKREEIDKKIADEK